MEEVKVCDLKTKLQKACVGVFSSVFLCVGSHSAESHVGSFPAEELCGDEQRPRANSQLSEFGNRSSSPSRLLR